jgi:phosphate transport system permease protein
MQRGSITADNPLYRRRRVKSHLAMSLSIAAAFFGLAWLALILGALLWKGFGSLSPQVFTEMTPPPGSAGGLLNPIAGSALMVSAAILISAPIGILAGYGHYSKLTPVIRFINDILLSAPSIVVGLFIYDIAVVTMGHFSGWAGIMALAVLAIPIMVRTTEDMLLLVPNELREAAAALGAPRSLVIRRVAYRTARAGLITALNNQFWSTDLSQPIASLPVVIFQFALSPYEEWQDLAWAGALIITMFVLITSIAARALAAPRGTK